MGLILLGFFCIEFTIGEGRVSTFLYISKLTPPRNLYSATRLLVGEFVNKLSFTLSGLNFC